MRIPLSPVDPTARICPNMLFQCRDPTSHKNVFPKQIILQFLVYLFSRWTHTETSQYAK